MEKLHIGTIHMKAQGFGFVIIEGRDDDIFVAREDLNGAIHNDMVEVREKNKRGRTEGIITKVIERRINNIVGTLMKSKTGAFIIPDDERLGTNFCVVGGVPSDRVGQKVVTRMTDGGNTVKVIEFLGDESEVGVDITSIIRAHNLYQEFPADVEREAREVIKRDMKEAIERRMDLRKDTVITIDPADARDLDDAVSLERRDDGMWELGVHIADVTHYVRPGSLLDAEAYKRGTSVYFPDRVLPMLPPELSNDVCSLHPNVDRLTLSVFMTIDPNGDIIGHNVQKSVINIKTRFSYDEVQEILDNPQSKHKHAGLLNEMATLAKTVEKIRRSRGEVVFDVPEPKIVLCPDTGKIRDVVAYPHNMSHRIIETFMILANETVARKMNEIDIPFIYRIHEKPDPTKVTMFVETLKPFAVTHKIEPLNPRGQSYQHMLDGLTDELRPIVSQLALRSMQKAKYSEKNVGHFGLGAAFYSHFTSPIRRYPDLAIHRIIKMFLARKITTHRQDELRGFVKEASVHCTKREIAATEAEREVDNLKRAEFMRDKIGEEFVGTISGIKDFGVFVYLPNTVEGLIRIESMPKDNYSYNEKQMTMVGRKRTWKMGDKINVIVAGVNMTTRKVEFSAAHVEQQ
ncbi:MAG: ribonuclease R [Firmicutes bacterium]|nr:ribonuclease R [Bacillota bacterium]